MDVKISTFVMMLKRQPNNAWIKPDGTLMYVAIDNAVVELHGKEGEFTKLTDHEILTLATEAFGANKSQ